MKTHRTFPRKRNSTLGGHFRSLGGVWTGRLSSPEPGPNRPYDVLKSSNRMRAGQATFLGVTAGSDRNGGWDAGGTAGVGADAEYVDENPEQRRMRLEAVLLVAKNPLTPRKLAQLAHLADGTEVRTLVRQLNQIYDDHGRAVRVERVAGGFRLLTRSAYAPWLTRLGHLPQNIRLSSPMMETLAVVAYRQNVSRADVESVRGVACGELLRQLMERDLIRIAGRSDELGRPYLYGTTKRFLQLFGLASLDALPPIQWEPILEDNADLENDTDLKNEADQVSIHPPSDLESPHPDPSTADENSTSTKESVVSTAVATVIPTIDTEDALAAAQSTDENAKSLDLVTNVIEDEEDDLYEGDSDFDDDDEEEDEDWDDDYMDDDEDDDDEDIDEDDDDWEEVDDDDDDLDEDLDDDDLDGDDDDFDDEGDDDWDDDDDDDWDDDDEEEEDDWDDE